MTGERPSWRTREFSVFLLVFTMSLLLLIVNVLFSKNSSKEIFSDVLSAILTASLIGIGQILLGVYLYKKQQQPFHEFWGQEYGAPSGRIILQSDRLQGLTEDLTRDLCANLVNTVNGPDSMPQGFKTDLNSFLETRLNGGSGPYKYGAQRVFKARKWLNRCDVEGARNIREAFTDLGFTPPDFVTCDRDTASPHELNAPFEIYMGLGYTTDIEKHIKTSCRGFLSIKLTEKGDTICLRDSIAGNALDEFERVQLNPGFSVLYPKGWEPDSYAAGETLADYAYILRDVKLLEGARLGETQVVFHVAGFTEYGTWAAGHFLRHEWKRLYTEHVQKRMQHGGRFAILLKGESPFSEPKSGTHLWKEVQVIKHHENGSTPLNDTWDTDLAKLLSDHVSQRRQ